MSFGFGVGDILIVTNYIVTTIRDIHRAPKELLKLADGVLSVEETLESLDDLPCDAAAGNTRHIARRKGKVEEVLEEMRIMVIKYVNDKGRVNAFNRAMYGILDKRAVADLLVKLEKRTKDLTDFLIVQTWRLTDQIRPLIDRVLRSTHQEEERAKVENSAEGKHTTPRPSSHKATDSQATVSDQIDQVQTVLDHVLQTERPDDSTLLHGQEEVSVEKEIEIQLGQAGVPVRFTKALIEVINRQRQQLAHPEDIDPISYTGGKTHLEVPKGWIMVVDSYNEGNAEDPKVAPEAILTSL